MYIVDGGGTVKKKYTVTSSGVTSRPRLLNENIFNSYVTDKELGELPLQPPTLSNEWVNAPGGDNFLIIMLVGVVVVIMSLMRR